MISAFRARCRTRPFKSTPRFSRAALRPFSLFSPLPSSVSSHLQQHGYAVVDNVFDSKFAAACLDDIKLLRDHSLLFPNSTQILHGGKSFLLEKQNVLEMELGFPDIRELLPSMDQVYHDTSLMQSLNSLMPSLHLKHQAIKMQCNTGSGGCFPMHFDSDAVDKSGRKVTAIVYLNPDYQPSHGGQLRLYPFPSQPVDIEPVMNRMVLFSSRLMLHRVLPSFAQPRICFTIWFSAGVEEQAPKLALPTLARDAPITAEQAMSYLTHPAIYKHAAKLAYADEWAQSIRESHPESEAREQTLSTHWREVDIISRLLAQVPLSLLQQHDQQELRGHMNWFA